MTGPTPDPSAAAVPRRIAVVVDNDSWILPYAAQLADEAHRRGHSAQLLRDHASIPEGDVAFYLGCIRITPPDVLARNGRNLVVHESALPKGRGFAPMTWQILEGARTIPVALIEAADEADAGRIVLAGEIELDGTELAPEWRALQGQKTVELCLAFLDQDPLPAGQEQEGEPSHYARRRPADSRLDPQASLAEQFELLRVCDNERYPAYFEHRGRRYLVKIEPDERGDS